MTLADAEDAMQRKALRYDKGGDQHYDYISAWIKSTRGSDPDASLYYLAAMLEGGEDARFIVRRMVILASEDVGNADPQALQVAVAAAHAVEHVGLPEATYALAQCAIYLALAPKSNAAGRALGAARRHIQEAGAAAPPAALRSAAYPAARKLGRGIGYDYPHDHAGQINDQEHLPAGARAPALLRPRRHGAASCASAWPGSGRPGAVTPELTAQSLWSLVPVASRARYIRRTAVAMLDELDDLSRLLAEATGWPREHVVLSELLPAVARPAHAGRPRPARARRPARDPARRVAGRAQHAARALARRRRGPARPVRLAVVRAGRWRPPRRCWRATP